MKVVHDFYDIKELLKLGKNITNNSIDRMSIIIGIIFLKHVFDKHQKALLKIKEEFPEDEERKNWENDIDKLSEYDVVIIPTEKLKLSWFAEDSDNIQKAIDDAFEELEQKNEKLKGLFEKIYNKDNVNASVLAELIDKFQEYDFSQIKEDLIGMVYENYLYGDKNNYMDAYTPNVINELIIRLLKPEANNEIYDPFPRTCSMLIKAKKSLVDPIDADSIKVYGQNKEEIIWKLGQINLLMNSFLPNSINLGAKSVYVFEEDLHDEKKFDVIMAYPKYKSKELPNEFKESMLYYGEPTRKNANFTWINFIASKLKEDGRAGIVIYNGTLTGAQNKEYSIRKEMIKRNHLDAIINLPRKLNKQDECIWIINNKKNSNNVLFINAEEMGELKNKSWTLTEENINDIVEWYNLHKEGKEVKNQLAKTINIEEIRASGYSFDPKKYIMEEEKNLAYEDLKKEVVSLKNEFDQMLEELNQLAPEAKEAINLLLNELTNKTN